MAKQSTPAWLGVTDACKRYLTARTDVWSHRDRMSVPANEALNGLAL